MLDKADRIEKAMCNIPVADRGELAETQNELVREVHKAIASYRYLPFFRIKGKDKYEDLATTGTYKKFKEQIDKFKEDNDKEKPSLKR